MKDKPKSQVEPVKMYELKGGLSVLLEALMEVERRNQRPLEDAADEALREMEGNEE